jgi:hypothetical protein
MSSHPHHHHGHDQHPAASAHDVVQANREFFEGEGKGRSIMKTEDALRGAQSSAEAIRAAVGSLEGLDVLDFACGPGELIPYSLSFILTFRQETCPRFSCPNASPSPALTYPKISSTISMPMPRLSGCKIRCSPNALTSLRTRMHSKAPSMI